jgi:hypothetical protein
VAEKIVLVNNLISINISMKNRVHRALKKKWARNQEVGTDPEEIKRNTKRMRKREAAVEVALVIVINREELNENKRVIKKVRILNEW